MHVSVRASWKSSLVSAPRIQDVQAGRQTTRRKKKKKLGLCNWPHLIRGVTQPCFISCSHQVKDESKQREGLLAWAVVKGKQPPVERNSSNPSPHGLSPHPGTHLHAHPCSPSYKTLRLGYRIGEALCWKHCVMSYGPRKQWPHSSQRIPCTPVGLHPHNTYTGISIAGHSPPPVATIA